MLLVNKYSYAYDDIQLFLELFDLPVVIERITSKANLIEKQLNRSGMYPLPQTPLPSTSGFIPRPTFQPIMPAAPPPAAEEAKPQTVWAGNTHCYFIAATRTIR